MRRRKGEWTYQLSPQEVAEVVPEAIVRGDDGYLRVDYARLGLQLMTWEEWDRAPSPARTMLSSVG